MANSLYKVVPGLTQQPLASDINQFVDALNGVNDIGQINLAASILPPVVTSVTAVAAAGTPLNVGTYLYKFTYVTGYKKTDAAQTIVYAGETTGSTTISVTTTTNNEVVQLAGLPTAWPSTAVAMRIYRTAVGGTDGTQKLVATITVPTSTYTDTVADASLGVATPTTNTTGTTLNGTWNNSNLPIQGGNQAVVQNQAIFADIDTRSTVINRDTSGRIAYVREKDFTSRNLLPDFTEWTYVPGPGQQAGLNGNGSVDPYNPYKYTLNAIGTDNYSALQLRSSNGNALTVGQTYTYSALLGSGAAIEIFIFDVNSTILWSAPLGTTTPITFTVPANTNVVELRLTNRNNPAGTYVFQNPQLEVGSVATAFAPQTVAKTTINRNVSGKITSVVEYVGGKTTTYTLNRDTSGKIQSVPKTVS